MLIAEADAADAQILTPERKEQVMAKLRSYVAAWPAPEQKRLAPQEDVE